MNPNLIRMLQLFQQPLVDNRLDASGRRRGNSDLRVSDAAKAEMPAYGFEGLTIGDILKNREEQDRILKMFGGMPPRLF